MIDPIDLIDRPDSLDPIDLLDTRVAFPLG
jgi:hypothetical protein